MLIALAAFYIIRQFGGFLGVETLGELRTGFEKNQQYLPSVHLPD